jgi:hypothetical protein
MCISHRFRNCWSIILGHNVMSSIKVISTSGFRDSGSKLTICVSNVGCGVDMINGGAVSQAGQMLLAALPRLICVELGLRWASWPGSQTMLLRNVSRTSYSSLMCAPFEAQIISEV